MISNEILTFLPLNFAKCLFFLPTSTSEISDFFYLFRKMLRLKDLSQEIVMENQETVMAMSLGKKS